MRNDLFTYEDLRFADIQLLRYRVPAFEGLSLRQKQYVYHLAEAALSGRDILWDQNCRHNLDIRHLLEDILLHSAIAHEGKDWDTFLTYLRQVCLPTAYTTTTARTSSCLPSRPNGSARLTA